MLNSNLKRVVNLIAILSISLLILSFQEPFKISGKYKVVHNDLRTPNGIIKVDDFEIVFNKDTYKKTFPKGEKVNGTLKRIKVNNNETIIYLNDIIKVQLEIQLDSLLWESHGNPVIELQELNADTIPFRTTFNYNLHITKNEGMLIRVN